MHAQLEQILDPKDTKKPKKTTKNKPKLLLLRSLVQKQSTVHAPYTQDHVLLLLSHFSRVRLCATPEMAAHQAPLSLGFSRQEHWSGLPFPSPNA